MAGVLDDVLRALRESGVQAVRRDWALGRTIVVPGGTRCEQKGIVGWERVVWVVDGEGFSVVHPDLGTLARHLSAPEAARIALRAVGDGGPVLVAAAGHVRVVEAVAIRSHGYVIVDNLTPERPLVVDGGATLDGCPLQGWLDQPRVLDSDVHQIAGRFALVFCDDSDLAHFSADQVACSSPAPPGLRQRSRGRDSGAVRLAGRRHLGRSRLPALAPDRVLGR